MHSVAAKFLLVFGLLSGLSSSVIGAPKPAETDGIILNVGMYSGYGGAHLGGSVESYILLSHGFSIGPKLGVGDHIEGYFDGPAFSGGVRFGYGQSARWFMDLNYESVGIKRLSSLGDEELWYTPTILFGWQRFTSWRAVFSIGLGVAVDLTGDKLYPVGTIGVGFKIN